MFCRNCEIQVHIWSFLESLCPLLVLMIAYSEGLSAHTSLDAPNWARCMTNQVTRSATESAANGVMPNVKDVQVAVIGAGFSGIGMGHRMLKAGFKDFLIFERASELGGTWRDNVYPGAECDIPTDLYSYSFAPRLKWSGAYAPQKEILDYLRTCADQFGLENHFRFDHELQNAKWDDNEKRWVIETSQGTYRANLLVGAMGYLCEPKYPTIPGLEDFVGTTMHSSRWDKNCDLQGKRVAVIGTGASAIQIVPKIQPLVERLDVYQRTPPWIMSKHGHTYGPWESWAHRKIPGYHFFMRHYHRLTAELVAWQLGRPYRAYPMKKIALGHLKKSVKDPELRQKLTPDYTIGCRRILFSDTFYQALEEPNVELICDPIEEIHASGISTADGVERPVDVLVLATGFENAAQPFAKRIVGEDNRPLWQAWADGQYAYLGSSVAGFPNFFMLLGPNANVGHTSATLIMEAQIDYVVDALRVMQKNGIASVDVKHEIIASYNDSLQSQLAPSVWNSGNCYSYYLNSEGKNTTVWPFTTIKFRKLARRFDVENYKTHVCFNRQP